MNSPAQESRTATVSLSVTPTEKRLVEIVLLRHPEFDGASNLLRERSLSDVLEEGREILRLIGGDDAGKPEGAEAGAALAVSS